MEGIRKVFFAVFLLGTLTLLIWYVLSSPNLRVRYNELPEFLIPSKNITTKARTHLDVSRVLRNATTSVKKYLYKDSNKSDCQDRLKHKYKPMSLDLPLIALASPWRSGNTWIRHLLQMATEFRTVGQPKLLRWWLSFNDYWLNEFKGQVYPVLYTNFLRDADKELRKVLTFLGVEFTDDDIECATLHKEGNFHRKPRVWTRISNIKELFSADMQRQIDNGISNMTRLLLKKHGVTWVNDRYTVNE